MDAPKHKRPANPSVPPEVVPGNVEPSNDSLDSPNLFTISRTGTLMISGTLSLVPFEIAASADSNEFWDTWKALFPSAVKAS